MKKDTTQMPRKAKDNTTLYLRPVPTDIKNAFKAECAKRGVTMLDAHILFMRYAPKLLPKLRVLESERERAAQPAL